MKSMERIRRFAVLLMAVFLLLSLSACSLDEAVEENAEVRQMTEQMLDSVLQDDYDTARGLMKDSTGDEEFRDFYDGAQKLFEGVESYTLTMIGVKYSVTDGVNRYTAVYRLTTNAGQDYDLSVGTSSDMEGLFGFHLTHSGGSEAVYTGTLSTLKQATVSQWVILIIGFATIVFLIAMLVDCCRQRIEKKWLWILLIVFGSVALLLTLQNGSVEFNINFFNFLSYTALLIYQNPANVVQIRLFVPVGAIVYLAFRRRLLTEARTRAEKDMAYAEMPVSAETENDNEDKENP